MFRYERDPRVGDWLRLRLGPFGPAVGSLVPRGFAAYARVLHPMADEAQRPVRWAEVAAATGRVLHPTAQSWRLMRRSAPFGGSWSGPDAVQGSLPELRAVARVLGAHTAPDEDLVAAFWEGTSWEGGMMLFAWVGEPDGELPPPRPAPPELDPDVLHGPKLGLPHRAYLLFRATPDDLVALADGQARADVDPFRPGWRTPNLLWPADHSWCLATEVDLDSTVVGGSRALVGDLLSAADLEVLEVVETDSLGYDDDRVNAD
ncbi:hypothetical protein [uncultured Cellulomonas sp.]|uniref:hypothetical protein n=1 Tax=uncultured Cellulomonas sp. TaxID=189682 RepID=UPI0028E751CF|nr:hypothetical protein [uncultured Cellulomonas sp.]